MSRTKRAEMDMIHGSIWNKIPNLPAHCGHGHSGAAFQRLRPGGGGQFHRRARNACVAAVSSNSAIVSLVVNFFVGIGLGANVVIANALGRDDRDMVEKTVHTAILLSVLGGILMAAFGESHSQPSVQPERAGGRVRHGPDLSADLLPGECR